MVVENGFYLQEEDADGDGDAATSEGIFVYTGTDAGLPEVGDAVTAVGEVEEYFDQTQLGVDSFTIASSGNALPTAAVIALSTEVIDYEAVEGMLVSLVSGIAGEAITVTQNFNLDRFGEIVVSAGTLTQPTQLFDAQTEAAEVAALQAANANNSLTIDDGSSTQNPDEFMYIANDTVGDNGNGYLDAGDDFTESDVTLRLGAEIADGTTGVMTYAFGEYKMVVQDQLAVDETTNTGAREDTPADVGGDIQIASFNVLNYFTTLDAGGAGTGPDGSLDPRGATTADDLERQTTKLVEAITTMEAEVVALQEIENNGHGTDSAIATLVDELNAEADPGVTYAYVDPTGTGDFIGTDAIMTGIIYDAGALTLVASDYIVFEESSAATTYALADVLQTVLLAEGAISSELVGDFQRSRRRPRRPSKTSSATRSPSRPAISNRRATAAFRTLQTRPRPIWTAAAPASRRPMSMP